MDKEWTEKDKLNLVLGIHRSEDVDNFYAWTMDDARKYARSQGLRLTDEHFEVIRFLRVHYENVGAEMPKARDLMTTLKERFSDKGGLKYLYSLFPKGPLNQGCRIAGVPVPKDAKDTSFGTVY